MNDAALGVLLLLLGGITFRICVTGDYRNYVRPALLPLLLIAAVALLAIGGVTVWHEFSRERALRLSDEVGEDHAEGESQARTGGATPDGSAHDDAPDHHAHAPAVGWLLLLPVIALALLAPPALGADAATHAGTALAEPAGDFPPLPETDPVDLRLLDYAARAVFDEGSLAGREVALTGFVTVGPAGETFLTRMVANCCAADARPVKVGLEGDVPPDLGADTWLRVTGHYTPTRGTDAVNGGTIPYVEVVTATPIPTPADPYAF